MFYQQITDKESLIALQNDTVITFDNMAAIKVGEDHWTITGINGTVNTDVLLTLDSVFNVVSQYNYYPKTGYGSGQIDIREVVNLIKHYGSVPGGFIAEWIVDYYDVEEEIAYEAFTLLVDRGDILYNETTQHFTLS